MVVKAHAPPTTAPARLSGTVGGENSGREFRGYNTKEGESMRVKALIVLLVVALLAGSAILILGPHRVAAQRDYALPKAWGKFVAFDPGVGCPLFEASDGTLRCADRTNGKLFYTIKRN